MSDSVFSVGDPEIVIYQDRPCKNSIKKKKKNRGRLLKNVKGGSNEVIKSKKV
jgi:hypothetical protein